MAEETLFFDEEIDTCENNYQDSVVFAKGKAYKSWQTLVNKGATKSDNFAKCRLNFANKVSDSRAVQAEANTISIKERLAEVVDEPTRDCITPDDLPPSRAVHIYESICNIAVDNLGLLLVGDGQLSSK